MKSLPLTVGAKLALPATTLPGGRPVGEQPGTQPLEKIGPL
jgi:hypothetical protein